MLADLILVHSMLEMMCTENVKASFSNEELVVTVPKKAPKKIEDNEFIPIE